MITHDQIVSALESGLGFEETSVIVQSSSAIAEVHGILRVWRVAEWVLFGEVGQTHVYVRIVRGCHLRYRQSDDKNAALELAGPDGEVLCCVTFRGTNPTKTDSYRSEHASSIRESFCWLAESGET